MSTVSLHNGPGRCYAFDLALENGTLVARIEFPKGCAGRLYCGRHRGCNIRDYYFRRTADVADAANYPSSRDAASPARRKRRRRPRVLDYPKGGNPFKMYGTTVEISVLAVSRP